MQYGNSFTILLGHTVHTRAERLMNLSEISYYENGVSDGCAHTTVAGTNGGVITPASLVGPPTEV